MREMVTQDFYEVPHNHVILKFKFWLTSEARRAAAVWTKQLKSLLINETSGRMFSL
jgi:hypothetical protein